MCAAVCVCACVCAGVCVLRSQKFCSENLWVERNIDVDVYVYVKLILIDMRACVPVQVQVCLCIDKICLLCVMSFLKKFNLTNWPIFISVK